LAGSLWNTSSAAPATCPLSSASASAASSIRPPRAIDDPHALLGLGEVCRRQDIARLVGQRRVQRDEIGLGQQRVEIGFLDPDFDRAFLGQEGIVGDDLHAQAQRAAGDDAADIARANQAQRLARHFDAHEVVLGPFARLRADIGGGDLPCQCEHHRNGVFGRGDRIAERRVHHHHTLAAGVGDIDIVDADARTADHLEVFGSVEDFGRDLGRAADGKAIVLADHRLEFVGRHARLHVDVATALFENAGGVRVHLVRNKDFGFVHDFSLVIPAKAGIAFDLVGASG
jgi:hypothetical protein